MAARAMWKAVIRLADLQVPVKLYAALEDRSVHFRLLHRKDLQPVNQSLINPESGDIVPHDQTARAYVTDSGERVLLSSGELQELQPEASRDIAIDYFLPVGAIDHRWYDRPYYLGPDGASADYHALTQALEETELEGLAHWVMRNRAYVGTLRLYQDYPLLMSLRHAEEVIPVDALQPPRGPDLDKRELDMARQLIGMLEAEFRPEDYEDQYRNRVLEMLTAKAAGKKVKTVKPKDRPAPAADIRGALEASLKEARQSA